ncbi:MAG: LPS assembly lipoprotein LptE [Planctomycetaceae bacterium]|jgi:hypothetical protein|nr:LPS assembly lipoprotein LptE [Planctomycetaceae bacterium]
MENGVVRAFFIIHCSLFVLFSGCIGLQYNVGTKSLFGQDVQTVYVPIFQTDGSRRDLAEQLTEAVCKRIESRSPYKVVSRPTADSVLEGRIAMRKQMSSILNKFSDPRQKTATLAVEVKWKDRRERDLRHFDAIPWNDGSGGVTATDYLVAEYGQSELTMEQRQINTIADQIVGMMEMPW